MKFDINALIQKQKRPIKDKKQLSAELKKTIELYSRRSGENC